MRNNTPEDVRPVAVERLSDHVDYQLERAFTHIRVPMDLMWVVGDIVKKLTTDGWDVNQETRTMDDGPAVFLLLTPLAA